MLIKTIELDLTQFNDFLKTPITKTYKDLIVEIKKNKILSVSELITILKISISTHNRYLKKDNLVPNSIKLHLELFIKTNTI